MGWNGAQAMQSTFVVLGAAGAIGSALVRRLTTAGHHVLGPVLSAAAACAGRGLRVNAVAPGLVETPLTAGITGNQQAAVRARAAR